MTNCRYLEWIFSFEYYDDYEERNVKFALTYGYVTTKTLEEESANIGKAISNIEWQLCNKYGIPSYVTMDNCVKIEHEFIF